MQENFQIQEEDQEESQQKDLKNQNQDNVQYLYVGNKAGMDNVDQEKIKQIINEATNGTEFHKKQQQKRQELDQKIQEMLQIISQQKQNPQKYQQLQKELQEQIQQFEKQRKLDRIWVNFDMDMFFVACELKERPELINQPVATGGLSMISTANYVARKFGVRSAMPGFIAKKICPQLILIPSNFEKYSYYSKIFKDILIQYDPEMEGVGLDEANLDITDYCKQNNITTDEQIYELCQSIREKVNKETGLTCSCGIAANRMLSKICSDQNKPNGQFQLKNDAEEIKEFIGNLPIRKIPGIGNVTEQLLKGIGIEKCKDILEKLVEIKLSFTDNNYESLAFSALGIARNEHVEEKEKQSISVSRTFTKIQGETQILEKIALLSQMLAQDVQDQESWGKNISVQVKNAKFEVKQRNKMLDRYIQSEEDIRIEATKIIKEMKINDQIRLLGIKLATLISQQEYEKLQNQSIDKFINKNEKRNRFQEENEKKNRFQEENDENINENSKIQNCVKEKNEELKKNHIPKVFECPVCLQQMDSFGNVSYVNSHINNCLKKLEQGEESNIESQSKPLEKASLGKKNISKNKMKKTSFSLDKFILKK